MSFRDKLRHWLANQAQVFVLLGPRKWLKGQLAGIVIGAIAVLIPSCVFV